MVVLANGHAAHAYAKLKDMLTAAGNDMSTTRLGVDGYQGMINLYDDADNRGIIEMVNIEGNEQAGVSFDVNIANCRIWKLSDEAALQSIATATTEASNPSAIR